jgi:hypothetical protein
MFGFYAQRHRTKVVNLHPFGDRPLRDSVSNAVHLNFPERGEGSVLTIPFVPRIDDSTCPDTTATNRWEASVEKALFRLSDIFFRDWTKSPFLMTVSRAIALSFS